MVTASLPGPLSTRRKFAYACVTVALVFGAAEGGLRVAGFRHPTTLESMAFTFPLDAYNAGAPVPFLQRDDLLFWKPRPGVVGHNSRGVFGPEFSTAKDPRQFRIVTLGDSCTHFGPVPYPQRWQGLLNERVPGRFEVINAGVIGYSSYQGLTLLTHDVSEWRPDLVTVYFGWNDHWLARGYSDREQRVQHGAIGLAQRALDHLRCYQWLASVIRPAPHAPRVTFRVSLQDYADNLRAMKRAADAIGARIWFITAPHALDLGIPEFLRASGEVADPDGLIALHERYNDQVRAVARDLGVTVVDLDRMLAVVPHDVLFQDDRIHLSDAGRTIVASLLLDRTVDLGLLK